MTRGNSRSQGLALLGATGSIGRSAIDVVKRFPDHFRIEVMTARTRVDQLATLAAEVGCTSLVVESESDAVRLSREYPEWTVAWGAHALADCVSAAGVDFVLNGLVGIAGLVPTLEAIRHGRRVATANKESIVVGGELLLSAADGDRSRLVPIDSEHSAIWSLLHGRSRGEIESVVLTASGGSFRDSPPEEIETASVRQALNHPNWDMGSKITIDSATMMNKGFEVIEANVLFDIDWDRIEVVLHRESLVHGMIRTVDGEIYAQIGPTDMRHPIQTALTWPKTLANDLPRLDLTRVGRLSFEPVDDRRYPLLRVAYQVGRAGGLHPVVFNAANEAAVAAFLDERIHFGRIREIIIEAVESIDASGPVSLDSVLELHERTLRWCGRLAGGAVPTA